MAADRSFVFGFRTGHCVRGIVLFGGVAILDLGWALFATSTVIRAVNGVVAALLALLAAQMVRHLVARVRGTRRVVVGARMLTSPTGFALGSPTAEIAYGDMRDVTATGGEKGRVRITHPRGTLEIDRLMLGSDGELDELVGVLRKRVRR